MKQKDKSIYTDCIGI